ncbi:phosphoglycerate mutase-like protein [Rickenella mellea]|uniref:Phosphoglycerate mutase-like protein n=1 Tax=Rickenella mellea TaxID=50990 RepID=A0A4Y7Q0M6_9AGAM|nr:phosphoglycerate mutase-like protein [Rickenella mellea]
MSALDNGGRGAYKPLDADDQNAEGLGLLSESSKQEPYDEEIAEPLRKPTSRYGLLSLSSAFAAGILSCIIAQILFQSCCSSSNGVSPSSSEVVHALAPSHVGSSEIHDFPPASPTNGYPSYFPSHVGYAGVTPTGAEPGLMATAPALPIQSGGSPLVLPNALGGSKTPIEEGFDMFKHWGNLSPWYSNKRGVFGVDSGPDAPEGCVVTALHFLHRHGARYPTSYASYGGPADFARRLHKSAAKWNASGELSFLNDWTYKLGEEILTPFGRKQLFDMGISLRLKYGYLLKNFTESNTIPVFRTESQDRMLQSALNFALGFFGYPIEGKYQQSITIEAPGFNNTLSPYHTCPNARNHSKADRALPYMEQWAGIYLKDALARFQPQIKGRKLDIEDVYVFQQMCAYETVALGYSKFCELFTEDEWRGFDYALDLMFWYNSGFGAPVARVQGIGYVQELIARITNTPIATHNSSTNATLDNNPITFPLDHSLYVDATHEVVVLNILTALNLTTLAASGPLPGDHIPANRSFIVSQLAPFATNVQFQLLSCSSTPDPQIRIIINDGVVPLTGIDGCVAQKDGMCKVDTFVAAQKRMIAETDWNYDCYGDWEVPPGTAWNTTTGSPPKGI